jgi:hypothetical protein
MHAADFKSLHERLTNNIDTIKYLLRKPEVLSRPEAVKSLEHLKYLFYSLVKSLIDIGHSIILEKDFRDPLNRADIFISLAEQGIIMPTVVPGVKRAVIALPKISSTESSEIIELASLSIGDLHKCLDSFAVYFSLRTK